MDANGDDQTPLTFGEGSHREPQWAPDGEWILFQQFREGVPQIYKMRKNGDAATPRRT